MSVAPSNAEQVDLLTTGELVIEGRILPASNATFLCRVSDASRQALCVYKPTAGERPLWDFPEGTLAGREVAAYLVSEHLGWNVVPVTLLREGPAGPGMVQLWQEADPAQDPVDVVPAGEPPAGYRHVLDAHDAQDAPVALVHEDTAPLRRMAVFDALVNNADRKGGHVLAMPGGHRYGVDHGVCFHEEDKLRTVLWGWSDELLTENERARVDSLRTDVVDAESELSVALAALVTAREIKAVERRSGRLLRSGRMPRPSHTWPAIPWPAF